MTRAHYVIFFLFSSATAFSQNVATVNNKPIAAREFLWVYKKNHQNTSISYDSLVEYLQRYINFKLKVLEARNLKMDKDTAYINEIKGYEAIVNANMRARLKKEEYEYIMNEYREGVLMFNISEKRIWTPRRSDAGPGMTEEEQQTLEKQWVDELRNKYQVKIDEAELRKLIKP